MGEKPVGAPDERVANPSAAEGSTLTTGLDAGGPTPEDPGEVATTIIKSKSNITNN